MCGICGAAWTNASRSIADGDMSKMVDRLTHRGPDDSGIYRDEYAALGFRRLSIVDLAGGHQPLSNETGTIWTVFNGEIYNFPALRHRLEAKGHTLKSTGDTEVLVHLYEDEGPEFFRLLRGMYALAIWDVPNRTLVFGRDRLGQKPLLYRVDAERISFASELKALLALPARDLPRTVDPVSIDQYLTYGYVPHPKTILSGVYKLPPAHYAVWHEGTLSLNRYWDPDWNKEVARPVEENEEQLRELLSQAVHEQMVADVPLGAFLSGGIDSTIIVGLMQKYSSQPVKTFSIGFDDPLFDESRFAEIAAKSLGTEHHAFHVRPEAWQTIPSLAKQFDEPFADSSALPTWFVSEETRKHVTVALTGDAGDELFGGYDRYRAVEIGARLDRLSPGVRKAIAGPIARMIPASTRAKTRLRRVKRLLECVDEAPVTRYSRWMTVFDETMRLALYSDAFDDQLATSGSDDPANLLEKTFDVGWKRDIVSKAMISDLLMYLPNDLLVKVDLASMAHSLECRGPFLDHRVVELALAMPTSQKLRLRGGRSKVVLKEAFAEYLPQEIKTRPKMGFGVPIDRWFRNELKDELQNVLLDPSALARGLFRPESVSTLLQEHVSGQKDHAYRLWALMMLELWFREYG